MRISVFVLPLLAGLGLSACQHSAAVTAAEAPGSATPLAVVVPADDNLNAVLWMQRSAEYQAASLQTYRAAAQMLDRRPRTWTIPTPGASRTAGRASRKYAGSMDFDRM